MNASGIDAFKTVARSVQTHYESILNFFDNRSTNASAESFNAKVKAFRATLRALEILLSSCSDLLNYMPDFFIPQLFRLILDCS